MFLKNAIKKIPGVINLAIKLESLYKTIMYNDEQFKIKVYTSRHGRRPDLKNPLSFTEKLLWSSMNYRDDRFVTYADKYLVRKYVQEKIGEEYLIPIYDVTDDINSLNFDLYPNKFVLNATHGSNMVILCNDKCDFDVNVANKKMKKWLKTNYYKVNREWHYNYIKPRILVMQNISNDDGTAPWDYKFFCFNGEPYIVALDLERFGKSTKRNVYDMNWKQIDGVKISRPQDFTNEYPMPKNFSLMKELCKKLAKDFEHVRVDFYNVNGKIYFGELTFLHAAAGISGNITPWEFDLKLGGMYQLPKRNVDTWSFDDKK